MTNDFLHRLKRKLHRQLHLPRIAHTLPQEPVEVKQSRRDKRVDVVGVVEGIEHLDDRNDREAFVELDRPLNAPVKREVLVVFARGVAIRCRASSRRDRLGRSSLHAEVSFKSPTHLDKRKEVELVTDVAIRQRVVETAGCSGSNERSVNGSRSFESSSLSFESA